MVADIVFRNLCGDLKRLLSAGGNPNFHHTQFVTTRDKKETA